MRSSVSFQSGLTIKAKLALAGVIALGLGATAVVMMLVNGSLSFRKDDGADNPMNLMYKEDGESLKGRLPAERAGGVPDGIRDAFSDKATGSLPGDPPQRGGATSGEVPAPVPTAPPAQSDNFFKDNPFQE